jgi:hypothetical protein
MRTHLRKRRPSKRITRLGFEQLEDRTVLSAGIGVYLPGSDTFQLRNTATAGKADLTFQLPAPGSIPVVGDWNGDGRDDFGVFDAKTATWSLKYGTDTGSANAGVFQFGKPNALPVVGDWNGDGRDDIGTFDPVTATWMLRLGASPGPANAGTFQFGARGGKPVVGDWNGDGTDGIGTFRIDTTQWMLRNTASAGTADAGTFKFGARGGTPVVGDWNGDGKDGIGTFVSSSTQWTLRQTASAGKADAGTFKFGLRNSIAVAGDFAGPAVSAAAAASTLATVVLPPVNLNLLGVEVDTSPITVTVSSTTGDGKLLGNLLSTVNTLVDLKGASNAVNTVLKSTVGLLNSASLSVSGVNSGPLDSLAPSANEVLELFVAPVHLDLLGAVVDTSPIRLTITTHSGQGLVLGNVVTDLINLFNPPLPQQLDINTLNNKLAQLQQELDQQLPGIAAAPVQPTPATDGQILNVTVPPLDLNLLGLLVETSPIVVNASATSGSGLLLGNVLTTALNTLGATPQNIAQLNDHINAILAKVVGVLNASHLTLSPTALNGLPPTVQALLSPTLTAPAAGSTAPVLDLMIASSDGTTPPVDVNLLGLSITTSNIDAHLAAMTGDGQVLGNLLYNLANLADAGGPASLLNLLNLLGTNPQQSPGTVTGGAVTPAAGTPQQLLTINLNPLDVNLLGLEVQSDPIVVTVQAQAGDGKLLGNLLSGITTLINTNGVSTALNNVLSATVNLVNSASLSVNGVGSGQLSSDPAANADTPVLDLFVAPVHLDLLGLQAVTQPIHLMITGHSGNGLVLGNLVYDLAHLFDPPLPSQLNLDDINQRLAGLISQLEGQIPGITPAASPPVNLTADQFLQLTVPALNLNLLGLLLQTTPITVNGYSHPGNAMLLGNVLTTVLNTVGATRQNLTGLNTNLNRLLADVVGVLNASTLVISPGALSALPQVLQTLALPTLISATPGQTAPILDLIITNGTSGPPVDVNLMGLQVTTSNIRATLKAKTGDGLILGNLLYNTAHLLDHGASATLLQLLTELSQL